LFCGVGDVIFTADHMANCHVGIINHYYEVIQGIADLIGGGAAGDHHVAAEISASPTHFTAH